MPTDTARSPVSRALEAAGVRSSRGCPGGGGARAPQAGLTSDVLVLGGAYDGGWDAMLEHRMIPVVFRPEHLTALDAAAAARGVIARAHLKVDTGMGGWACCRGTSRLPRGRARLPAGLAGGPLLALRQRRPRRRGAHRAADHPLPDRAGADARPPASIRAGATCRTAPVCSRSRGPGRRRDEPRPPGTGPVRAAAGAVAEPPRVLEPVLSWKTSVVHLKSVPAGTPISYGSTWTAPEPRASPRSPVGYADGWSRLLSNRGVSWCGVAGHRSRAACAWTCAWWTSPTSPGSTSATRWCSSAGRGRRSRTRTSSPSCRARSPTTCSAPSGPWPRVVVGVP
jgi:alanine racemase